jgi:hypothetical protein
MGSEFCQALCLVTCLKLLKTINFNNNNNTLTIEIQVMCNVTTRMIPAITGATTAMKLQLPFRLGFQG